MKQTNKLEVCKKLVKRRGALPIICYSVIIVGWFLVMLFSFFVDMAYRGNGSLAETVLTPANFELVALEPIGEDIYQSTSDDPQMILQDVPEVVRTLRMNVTYSSKPHEIDLYYTTKPGQSFGKNMRVWPVLQEDGTYLFTLPREHIETLRLDPASAAVQINFESIVLNEPQSIWNYLNPGWGGLVMLLILPAFVAAVIQWGINVVQLLKQAKQKHKHK